LIDEGLQKKVSTKEFGDKIIENIAKT